MAKSGNRPPQSGEPPRTGNRPPRAERTSANPEPAESAAERARERLARQQLSDKKGKTAAQRARSAPQRSGSAPEPPPRAGTRGAAPAKPRPAGSGGQRPRPAAAGSRRPPARGKQKRSTAATAGVFGTVLVVAAVLIIVLVSVVGKTNSTGAFGTIPAPASVTNAITKVPAASFAEAGSNITASGPFLGAISTLKGKPLLLKNGKPEIVYVGSEWCPYCAATRWGLIVALARFGTFKGLHMTASSKTDIYPSTHTMSFYGSSFKSNYIYLSATEQCTDIPTTSTSLLDEECNGYKPLSRITTPVAKLFNKYDYPPYVSSTPPTPGGIPFVDFADQYHEDGAIMDPSILAGLTQAQIAGSMANPLSSPAQTILVTANYYTAYICKITKNKPGSVCQMPVVKQAARALKL